MKQSKLSQDDLLRLFRCGILDQPVKKHSNLGLILVLIGLVALAWLIQYIK